MPAKRPMKPSFRASSAASQARENGQSSAPNLRRIQYYKPQQSASGPQRRATGSGPPEGPTAADPQKGRRACPGGRRRRVSIPSRASRPPRTPGPGVTVRAHGQATPRGEVGIGAAGRPLRTEAAARLVPSRPGRPGRPPLALSLALGPLTDIQNKRSKNICKVAHKNEMTQSFKATQC